MKKLIIALIVLVICAVLFTSCRSAMTFHKKDCNGVRHTKQKGGFYL